MAIGQHKIHVSGLSESADKLTEVKAAFTHDSLESPLEDSLFASQKGVDFGMATHWDAQADLEWVLQEGGLRDLFVGVNDEDLLGQLGDDMLEVNPAMAVDDFEVPHTEIVAPLSEDWLSSVELEGLSHGPSSSLSVADEGSWIVVVDGDVLDPQTIPGGENYIDFGQEQSGTIFIADGLGGMEELAFDNIDKIIW